MAECAPAANFDSLILKSILAYGLTILSEISLPEAPSTSGKPDVTVRLGKVEKPPGPRDAERTYAIDRNQFQVFWRGVGTFAIRLGHEVVIEPDGEVEEAVLRQYL